MAEHSAGTIEIRNREIKIYVNDYGQWVSKEPDVTADSRDELREKLITTTRKAAVKLAIPATLHERSSLSDVTLLGRHGGNGNLMFSTGASTQQETTSYYSDHRWLRRLTADEKRQFLTLQTERDRAYKAFETFARTLDINPDKLIDAELEKAVAKEG